MILFVGKMQQKHKKAAPYAFMRPYLKNAASGMGLDMGIFEIQEPRATYVLKISCSSILKVGGPSA